MCVKVSVIIPVYNVENYVLQCIESVMRQTENNMEIIVVDDGSQDGSPALCDLMAEKDSRIYVIHQQNQGVSVSRNTGIEHATGEWICFIDGDDYICEDYIEKLLQFTEDADIDIVVGDYYVDCEGKEAVYSEFILNQKQGNLEKDVLIENCMIGNGAVDNVTCVGVPWAKLYRTSFLKTEGIKFKIGLKRNQDVIFNLYACSKARRVYYCKIAGYHYRVWANSAVNRYSEDYDKTIEFILREMRIFLGSDSAGDRYMHLYYQRVRDMFYEYLKLSVFHKDAPHGLGRKYFKFRAWCRNEMTSISNCSNMFLNKNQVILKAMIKMHLTSVAFMIMVIKRSVGRTR